VDSRASISLLPHRSAAAQSGPRLLGPEGSPIPSWGRQTLQLQFGGHSFTWQFVRAAVAFPILGLDFLKQHCFVLDAAGARLFNQESGQQLQLTERPSERTL
jgi:hypothetical protein